ncbi:GMC family oxidoreductase N-terminal domain-containing protein [Aestuariirhabdus sp. LZHN29]|uniref:GMC family oxidoreductase N-terminal domain-containing protein n=1 Tax=Aestuariirhabdus sp. LZHN29 TaxID=3417462 RepID=UPI003CE69E79
MEQKTLLRTLCPALVAPWVTPSEEEITSLVAFADTQIGNLPWTLRLSIQTGLQLLPLLVLGRHQRSILRLGDTQLQRLLNHQLEQGVMPLRGGLRYLKRLCLLHDYSPDNSCETDKRWPSLSVNGAQSTIFDAIVVGSGPGGCLSATRLAEAGYRVLLIEEGATEAVRGELFSFAEMSPHLRHKGINLSIGSPPIALAEGRTLGGGSEINSALYLRPTSSLLAHWQQQYGLILGREGLTPWLEKNEQELGVSAPPIAVAPASLRLQQGAESLGWEWQRVSRLTLPQGDKWQDSQRKHYRTMRSTLIPRFTTSGGALLSDCRAEKMSYAEGRWSIRLSTRDEAFTLSSPRLVIACGSLQTPALLRRSGLRRNIGNQLRMQPILKVAALFNEAVTDSSSGMGDHQVKEFCPDYSFGCAIASPQQLAQLLEPYPEGPRLVTEQASNLAIYSLMLHSPSDGQIRNTPGSDAPLVRYSLSPQDWRLLQRGFTQLGRLLFAAGAQALFPGFEVPLKLSDTEELEQMPPLIQCRPQLTALHFSSSCPGGENHRRCGCDSFGRVTGHPGLYLSDASLLPSMPTANPQGTLMGLARRNVEHWIDTGEFGVSAGDREPG